MENKITQRELRNNSGEIMRGLDEGQSYVVTRNGTVVAELIPIRRRRFVSAKAVLVHFKGAAHVDSAQFRADVDAIVDQSPYV